VRRIFWKSSTQRRRERNEVPSILKREAPEHIGSILEKLLANPEWKNKLQASIPLLRWQEIVGDKIARQSQPESLQNGVLLIRVANPAWLHHLRFLEEDLRQKLNKKLPSLDVKELRFRQGPLDQAEPIKSPSRPGKILTPRNDQEKPTPLDREQLRLLQSVTDPELRRNLESLFRRQLTRSRT
jgi:predicted nucleic acid-binding Zn ribbon protein